MAVYGPGVLISDYTGREKSKNVWAIAEDYPAVVKVIEERRNNPKKYAWRAHEEHRQRVEEHRQRAEIEKQERRRAEVEAQEAAGITPEHAEAFGYMP